MDPSDPYDAEALRKSNNFQDRIFIDEIIPENVEKMIWITQQMLKGIEPFGVHPKYYEYWEMMNKKWNELNIWYTYKPSYMKTYNRAAAVG